MSLDKNSSSEQAENNADNKENKKLSKLDTQSFSEQQKTNKDAEKLWVFTNSSEDLNKLDAQYKLADLKEKIPHNNESHEQPQNSPENPKDYISQYQENYFPAKYRAEYIIASAENAPENENSLSALVQWCKYLGKTLVLLPVNLVIDACKFSEYKYLPKQIIKHA